MSGITDIPAPDLYVGEYSLWDGKVTETGTSGAAGGAGAIGSSETSFMDALQEAQEKAEANKLKTYDRVTGSAYYDKLVKDTLRDIFAYGMDKAKESFSNLNHTEKQQVLSAVKKIMNAVREDIYDGGTRAQELFDALFGTKEADMTETDLIDSDELLKGMLLKIKEMRDASQSSDVILEALIPYLVTQSTDATPGQAEAVEGYDYEALGGTVGFTEGNTTYRMGLQQFLEKAEQFCLMASGIPTHDMETTDQPEVGDLPVDDSITFPEPDNAFGMETIPEGGEAEKPDEGAGEIPEEGELIPVTKGDAESEEDGELGAYQRIRNKTAELLEVQLNQQTPQAATVQNVIPDSAYSINAQVIEEITSLISQAQVRNSELVMRLNPETLGDISVKITTRDGAVSIVLSAQNEATADLLRGRLPQLIQSLKEINQNVQDVRVEASEGSQEMGFSLTDLGPGNSRGNTSRRSRYPEVRIIDNPEEIKVEQEVYKGGSRLWQTV